MTQTLEGIPAGGRPLGRRVGAQHGGSAVLGTQPKVTMPARHRGEAGAS
jgi:hypothetical protein